MKKVFHANGDGEKDGLVILISDKIDFKTTPINKDKEVHYITIKESIQEENITLVNIYAPNIRGPKYIKQVLIKGRD